MLNQQNINENQKCRGATLCPPACQESQNSSGITLVALIVTIIILLILAGMTIALLSGEDGILSRTEKAATSYETESIKEIVNLRLANLNAGKWINKGRKAVLKDLNELDDENSGNFDAEITLKNPVGDTDTSAILIYDKHEVEVDANLNIAKIDGEKYEGTSGGTSGGSSSGESGSASGESSSSIDSAEYEEMKSTITQLQATAGQMQEKINQLEAQSATKEELKDYATIEYANALPQNSGNYTDLNWTLLGTTISTSGESLKNVNIDDYNYICVVARATVEGIVNPVIMSVKQFKISCTDTRNMLICQWGAGYVAAYYRDGLVWAKTTVGAGNPCLVYGLK